MTDSYQAPPIPTDFIRNRIHSLMGIWLVLFLMEHLFTNSQAALFIGDDGNGFVRAVNGLKNLPYLPVIEVVLLGIPLLYHALWGIKILFTSKFNSFPTNGSSPSLTQYPRNHAYTWQRITSWILLIGIVAHVVQMRFLDYPQTVQRGTERYYLLPLSLDKGLYSLSDRLGFNLMNQNEIHEMIKTLPNQPGSLDTNLPPQELISVQQLNDDYQWKKTLEKQILSSDQILAIAPSFGLAELLLVRDTFKSPLMIFLYTVLVVAASFHAFNGLWTAMITWGVTLTVKAQNRMRQFAIGLMTLITFLGLSAIWGTYWINLYN